MPLLSFVGRKRKMIGENTLNAMLCVPTPDELREKERMRKVTEDYEAELKAKDVRSFNVGSSDYAKHKIQPWDIWIEYHLNPFDADIVKRVLRTKEENGMTEREARILDYEKIKHICEERIRQLTTGECWEGEREQDKVTTFE